MKKVISFAALFLVLTVPIHADMRSMSPFVILFTSNTFGINWQVFQGSMTFSSGTIGIAGNRYFFQSSAPASGDSILHFDSSTDRIYWGGDASGGAGGGGGGGGALFLVPPAAGFTASTISFPITDFGILTDGVSGATITWRGSTGTITASQTFGSSTTFSSGTFISLLTGSSITAITIMTSSNGFVGGSATFTWLRVNQVDYLTQQSTAGAAILLRLLQSDFNVLNATAGTSIAAALLTGTTSFAKSDFNISNTTAQSRIDGLQTSISTSDTQQTRYVNFRSTTDSQNTTYVNFRSTTDSQNTTYVNFRSTDVRSANPTFTGGITAASGTFVSSLSVWGGITTTGTIITSSITVSGSTIAVKDYSMTFSSSLGSVGDRLIITQVSGSNFTIGSGKAVTPGAGGSGSSDNLGSHVTTMTLTAISGGITLSSGIATSSFTAWGGFTSTAGYQGGGSTFTNVSITGSSISFNSQGFTLVFGSAPLATVGSRLIITQINGTNYLIGAGAAVTPGAGGGGGGGAVASFDGTTAASFSTMSIQTPYGLAAVANASSFSTFTVLGSTLPYVAMQIPASAWRGIGSTIASADNGGFAFSTGPIRLNLIAGDILEFKNSGTRTFAYAQFPLPEGWEASTIGVRFNWYAPSGTANTNITMGLDAVNISSGTTVFSSYGSSGEVNTTMTAANQMVRSDKSPGITIGGTASPGDLIYWRIFRDNGDGRDNLTAFAYITNVTIYYRKKQFNDYP